MKDEKKKAKDIVFREQQQQQQQRHEEKEKEELESQTRGVCVPEPLFTQRLTEPVNVQREIFIHVRST